MTCRDDECCGSSAFKQEPMASNGSTRAFKVQGMDCAEEVATLKRALSGLVAEDALGFDVLNGRMTVPAAVHAAGVIAAVAATGMSAEPWVEPKIPEVGQVGMNVLRSVMFMPASDFAFCVGHSLDGSLLGRLSLKS